MQNEPTEFSGTGSFQKIQKRHNIQHGESFSVVFPQKGKSLKFLVEEWKKPPQGELEARALSHVSSSALRSPKQWEEAPGLSQVKKADTRPLLHALHAAESGGNLSSSLQRIQSQSRVWACCPSPIPPVPEGGTREPGKIPGIHHLSRTLGGSVGFIIWMHAFYRLCTVVHSLAGGK
ncbi:hypothetical protein GWK47_024571 [Chionoecetes opilio]|uniref:Uncharacterized protein n=1 Tax=Chionoecetes opilio TaxID=41210 RepID=A0A8J5BT64_CHIOP|nr:hypothetical protein GWK47_024571 [Chionoecetes opilio]